MATCLWQVLVTFSIWRYLTCLQAEVGQMYMCWICQKFQPYAVSHLPDITFLRNFMNVGWRNSSESCTDQDCGLTHPLHLSVIELGRAPATCIRVSKSNSNRQCLLNGYKVNKPFCYGIRAGVTKVVFGFVWFFFKHKIRCKITWADH